MAQIGVLVQATEIPPASIYPFNTGNAFFAGNADWGPRGDAGVTTPVTSLSQAAAQIGGPSSSGNIYSSRTATNAVLFDACEAFFREGGTTLYLSRVVGTSPTASSKTLNDTGAGVAMTVTAAYTGIGGTNINVAVVNATTTYVITLTDPNGIVLATSPSLTNTNKADAIAWALTTGLITISAGTALLPASVSATPLTGGTDDHGTETVTNWTSALNGFNALLGPGQVAAPGITHSAVAGIWLALGQHAQVNNRIALIDIGDGLSAPTAISNLAAASISSGITPYCGFWAGFLQAPGVTPGTTRVVPPSPVVAALCNQVDQGGNPNLAAAGPQWPLHFVSGLNTTYTGALAGDINSLNSAGINVFSLRLGIFQNFGFVSGIPSSSDGIFWQLNHGRLRMAIIAQGDAVAEPYLFSQLDGQQSVQTDFGAALDTMLRNYWSAGALFGNTSADAYFVDVGTAVNTPATIAAGQLNALMNVRMSPFAQLVTIQLNAVAVTSQLATAASANQGS